MIPNSIQRNHIIAALNDIDLDGVPPGRASSKFQLAHRGKKYPPKYVISMAARHATGVELNASFFGGGAETNDFLRSRGFEVVTIDGDEHVAPPSPRQTVGQAATPKPAGPHAHSERCPECKVAVEALLKKIYGQVEKNHKIDASTRPEDYQQSPLYPTLRDIYEALQRNRGFEGFVRSRTLPNCDFYVPDPGFVLEFDESQHFTACRALALERYPSRVPFGFDKQMWLRLCMSFDT